MINILIATTKITKPPKTYWNYFLNIKPKIQTVALKNGHTTIFFQ